MSFQDRYYYRDSQSSRYNSLLWMLNGSVPLFKLAGIRVRAHVWLVIFVTLTLVAAGAGDGYTLVHRAVSMGMLVAAVLIHEFGHATVARASGGHADEVILTPLGGLAQAPAPQRPWPTLLTAAAGPLANLLTCIACALLLQGVYHVQVPQNPLGTLLSPMADWGRPEMYLWYLYVASFLLLIFNLLPILPLDGGHMLQSLLWRGIGHARAMMTAANAGMIGAAGVGLYALMSGNLLLFLIMALVCLPWCIHQRTAVQAVGPWNHPEMEFAATEASPRRRRHRLSRYTKWKARRQIRQEEAEQTQLDMILQKVHQQGLRSLTWRERRILRRATERQRQHDVEELNYR